MGVTVELKFIGGVDQETEVLKTVLIIEAEGDHMLIELDHILVVSLILNEAIPISHHLEVDSIVTMEHTGLHVHAEVGVHGDRTDYESSHPHVTGAARLDGNLDQTADIVPSKSVVVLGVIADLVVAAVDHPEPLTAGRDSLSLGGVRIHLDSDSGILVGQSSLH